RGVGRLRNRDALSPRAAAIRRAILRVLRRRRALRALARKRMANARAASRESDASRIAIVRTRERAVPAHAQSILRRATASWSWPHRRADHRRSEVAAARPQLAAWDDRGTVLEVVVATPDVVGERMAGPGIRATYIARELSKIANVTLIARGDAPSVSEGPGGAGGDLIGDPAPLPRFGRNH